MQEKKGKIGSYKYKDFFCGIFKKRFAKGEENRYSIP